MSKIKLSALVSVAAMLFACGTQDEDKPDVILPAQARLKNTDYAFVSPFDIFVAEFDSVITDLDKLDGKNIITSPDVIFMLPKGKTSSNKLYFIGTNTTSGGYHYLNPGREDSIVFKNLKNSYGYRTNAVLHFRTMQILDLSNKAEKDSSLANDIRSIKAINTSLDTALDKEGYTEFAGILEHTYSNGERNMEDWYKINLVGRDTVKIKVNAFNYVTTDTIVDINKTIEIKPGTFSEQIKIRIVGSDHKGKDTSFTKRRMGIYEFPYYVSRNIHLSDTTLFYLKVSDEGNINFKPNPYTISITVNKTK
jgi:hypothetical protein